eukprot:6571-Heterococcus_DN1.PRE.1
MQRRTAACVYCAPLLSNSCTNGRLLLATAFIKQFAKLSFGLCESLSESLHELQLQHTQSVQHEQQVCSCRTACTVAVLIACAAAVLRQLLYCSHPAAEASA